MSIERKFFLIFLFIILDSFLLLSFLYIRDSVMLDDLKEEINSLSKLDITKDRYNISLKTSGSYGVVEKSIKNYLDEYAVLLQSVLGLTKDSQFTGILSYDNYLKDGPEFKESLSYLENTKKKINSNIDKLLKSLDGNQISDYINNKIADVYFQNLYKELMGNETNQDTKDYLINIRDRLNNIIDSCIQVLSLLKENPDGWILEDNEIKFHNRSDYDKYQSIISKINS